MLHQPFLNPEKFSKEDGIKGKSFSFWASKIEMLCASSNLGENDKKILISIGNFLSKTQRITEKQASIILSLEKVSHNSIEDIMKRNLLDEDWKVLYKRKDENGNSFQDIVKVILPFWQAKPGNNFRQVVEMFQNKTDEEFENIIPPKRMTRAMLSHTESQKFYKEWFEPFYYSSKTLLRLRNNAIADVFLSRRKNEEDDRTKINNRILLMMEQKRVVNPKKIGTHSKVYEIMPVGSFDTFLVPEQGLRPYRPGS